MEIIKNNYIKPKEEYIHVQCHNCNSILKCTNDELNNDCPCCGKPLTAKTNNEFREDICDVCGKEFSYDISECTIGAYGLYYTTCPYCHKKTFIDKSIDIAVDDLKIEYFHDISNDDVIQVDAVHVPFSEIKEWIKRGVEYLKCNPDDYYHYTASGDSFVCVIREDDEFYVMYTNNYKDTYVKG